MIAYRRDIFEQEGVRVEDLEAWDDFIRVGRRLTNGKRYMIEMADNNANEIEPLLFQRGGGLFDAEGRCRMDDEVAVQTMLWYVPLVAGPNRIGNNLERVPSPPGQSRTATCSP